ncbi:hypothetical protein GCM10023336_40300 [Streptomyces similanensis]|uniref:Uncharacterized protein n=1 Tax=Streptomyces similanensis TaxID=1274988 RepID=A0ABP9KSP6_9ACTN
MTESSDTFARHARVRHRDEHNTAERRSSTPTVRPRPHTGQSALWPRCISVTRQRAYCKARQRLDLHLPEQNTVAADFVVGNGTPHSGQYRRTTRPSPYSQHHGPQALRPGVPISTEQMRLSRDAVRDDRRSDGDEERSSADVYPEDVPADVV